MKSDSHICSSDPAPGRSTKLKTNINLIGDFYNGITRRKDYR
ncbi:hypothetical protein SAMN02910398_01798 [Butyrivibrio sp. YAB3001]|nr:hypothetical protein SAMN02910398_01798 [Butyrivibrio sp. YAB3001]